MMGAPLDVPAALNPAALRAAGLGTPILTTSSEDPADVTAWAEAKRDQLLRALLAPLHDAPIYVLIDTLKHACQNGFGTWMVPDVPPNPKCRPATHLVEISLLGALGVGLSVAEAARSWRLCATNMTAPAVLA